MGKTSQKKQLDLHFEILPWATKRALDFLAKQEWLKDSAWYLAGGTALALQAGHRRSVDLDFFYEKKNFVNEDVLGRFEGMGQWQATVNRKNTIYGELFKAKISFIAYPFFVPKQKPIQYGTVRILDKLDVAVMKIIAISQRGRKRDFFDLYWCTQNVESLENIILHLKEQYPTIAHNYHHILKAMMYFNDADVDPDPLIFFDASWKQVKSFFRKEIPLIADKLMR